MGKTPAFLPAGFADIPGWAEDDHVTAFHAFRRSAILSRERSWKDGALGVRFETLKPAFEAACNLPAPDPAGARRFFETRFSPWRCPGEDGGGGLVTAYYEPEAEASPVRTSRFRYPLYRQPADLVKIPAGSNPAGLHTSFEWARRAGDDLVEHPDRRAIESGALEGRRLELAWLEDRDEVFFIHVQGSARLRMTDGRILRVGFAAKSGHPFTSIGRILVDAGEIDPAVVSMQSIRDWLHRHPHRRDDLVWRNRSFIFFRETPLGDPELGPFAAGYVQLTPGRSVALDRKLHCFGTPVWIDAPGMTDFGGPFFRLMIGQDTGSAIVGAARADLFAGTGPDAGRMAGAVKSPAGFWFLLPAGMVPPEAAVS
ncbi:transglycosylase [Zhengella mangrovi]|uniref:peptidoglycan lytic exotransglycosylase n=1 Tax=Zhengella mangrovi TaxID=1982044 RepID=A0A2G1QSW9_9HYPH|nr:MltA domain-containing protein [Zhengella mangrovi]PHP68623.1 transglycosylase [Zhengella mangrovi]